MRCSTRVVVAVLIVPALALLVACKSGRSPSASAPRPGEQEPLFKPTPTPIMIEEIVDEPETETIPSVAVQEELPPDLAELNRGGYLTDVFFDTDRYDLKPEARESLAGNAAFLQSYPSVRVLVEGHCDERNTREYNLALGERRANAVRDYLVFLGTAPERIQTISYGEERPFAQGHSEDVWQLNRRAHFVITAR